MSEADTDRPTPVEGLDTADGEGNGEPGKPGPVRIEDVDAFAFDLALDLWNRVCCHGKQPDGAYMGRVEDCVAEAIAEHGER